MATIGGMRKTYGYDASATTWDAQNEALDVSPMLDILRPVDVPLLTLIGRNSLDDVTSVKHEWLEDEYRGMTTVTAGLNNTTDPVAVTLTTAADTAFFRATGGTGSPANYSAADSTAPGDIVRIWDANGSELAIVTAVSGTAITLDRSQLGTTPVSHTTSANVTIIGTLQPQGLTSVGASRTTTKTPLYNYTQIFEDSFRASKTQGSTRKYTANNDRARELAKIMDLMGVQLERTLLFGQKQKPAATVAAQQGPAGAMGGIQSFITSNVYDKSGAVLTKTMLEDALQDVWEAGARSSHLFCNATQKRRINTFLDTFKRTDYSDNRLGTFVDGYDTDFGSVSVVMDRHMPIDEVLIIDASRIKFGPLTGNQSRAFTMTQRPVESQESELWQVSGEYTMEVRLEKSHARLYDLSTVAP
jgi:hypothetical protein